MPPDLRDALRYWEPRRVGYNAALAALACGWIVATWPHFRPAFTLPNLGRVVVLACLANLCYSAAYLVDLPLQGAFPNRKERPWRFPVWILGTVLALLIAHYWIGDEIYPSVG